QTMGLDADQDIFAVFDVSANQSNVGLLIESTLENDHAKVAVTSRQRGFANLLDKSFGSKAVPNKFGDGDDLQVVMRRKLYQIRHTRHRSVFLHDFANNACRREPCDSCQIDGGFGLSRPNQHAAITCAQWKDVAGPCKIVGSSLRIDCSEDRLRAV